MKAAAPKEKIAFLKGVVLRRYRIRVATQRSRHQGCGAVRGKDWKSGDRISGEAIAKL
jgi:hypothetical protein